MTRISTSTDYLVDYTPLEWRLLNPNGTGDAFPEDIFSVRYAENIRYAQDFANKHRLPARGLSAEHVQQVVLGWSATHQHWLLGLVFKSSFAEQRGGRWCGLTRWHDPTAYEYRAVAEESGLTLAHLLNVPFRIVPPAGTDITTAPALHVPALPALPISADHWTLSRPKPTRDTLHLKRHTRWAINRVWKLVWYGWWAIAFAGLSYATLTVDLALPNTGFLLPAPEYLPYLGFFAAVVIAYLFVQTLYTLLTQPDRFIIEPAQRRVSAQKGQSTLWELTEGTVDGVYVSQVTRHTRRKYVIEYGEINFNTPEGFRHLLVSEQEYERRLTPADTADRNDVQPLEDIDSPLEGIALHLARALGVPCWRDQR